MGWGLTIPLIGVPLPVHALKQRAGIVRVNWLEPPGEDP